MMKPGVKHLQNDRFKLLENKYFSLFFSNHNRKSLVLWHRNMKPRVKHLKNDRLKNKSFSSFFSNHHWKSAIFDNQKPPQAQLLFLFRGCWVLFLELDRRFGWRPWKIDKVPLVYDVFLCPNSATVRDRPTRKSPKRQNEMSPKRKFLGAQLTGALVFYNFSKNRLLIQ